MKNVFVYSFYRFKNLKNINKIKNVFDTFLIKKDLKGTILVASEGINGTVSGSKKDLDEFIKLLKYKVRIRKLDLKISKTNFVPFNRMKVRIKKEIVSLGQGNINVTKYRGKLVKPNIWNSIISNKNTKVIDVRNEFEIEIGKFSRSINPKTKSFRQFPKVIKAMKIKKNDNIAMYCTGGVRCEKASAFLKTKGFKNIVQLEGGILNYLEYIKKSKKKIKWNGDCFVFDDRVSLNKDLQSGKYVQCYGCRRPLNKKDLKSEYYMKGVSCAKCYYERSDKQKNNSRNRQLQIEKAENDNLNHPFKRIRYN